MIPATMIASLVLAGMDLAEAAFRSPEAHRAVDEARRTYERMRRALDDTVQQGRQMTPDEVAYWMDVVDRQMEAQRQALRSYYRSEPSDLNR